MPPDSPTYDQVDDRISRAVNGFEKLLSARMQTQDAKLDAILYRLEEQAGVRDDVEDLRSRMIAAEAFISAQEHRLGEARAYRRLHRPTIVLSSVGLVVAVVAIVAGFLH